MVKNFTTNDNLVSPRGGLIYKPFDNFSLYSNYSIAYVPRAATSWHRLH